MERVAVNQPRLGDVGLKSCFDIQDFDWVWHPELMNASPGFVEFSLSFECEQEVFEFEITADQRYEIYINETWLAAGPDAGEPQHWSFARYRVHCEPGEVTFKIFAWWLGQKSPYSRMSYRAGFALAGCGEFFPLISTGKAPWAVRRLASHKLQPQEDYEGRFIGDELLWDSTATDGSWVPAAKVPLIKSRPLFGTHGNGWRLYPAALPDQLGGHFCEGKIRGVVPFLLDKQTPWPTAECAPAAQVSLWQRVLDEGECIQIPAHSSVFVLWDFETYICGYPCVAVSEGRGATVRWEWAESLYQEPQGHSKGNRNDVAGKYFRGFGDTFIANGDALGMQGHWWRAGRYAMLKILTASEPLTLRKVSIRRTGYPWSFVSAFSCSNWQVNPIITISQRGLQNCSHETFVDCPYYEQLMYVGDTRIEALIGYTQSCDDRLARRSMELFDFSRSNAGFCSARYPSKTQVDILPFSMSWVWMLRDYLYWRDDFDWLRLRLPGMRSVMAAFEAYEDPLGMLQNVPGWNFVDWVDGWKEGEAPSIEGLSVILNMQYLLTLLSAADMEQHIGCQIFSEHYRQRAEHLAANLKREFWNPREGCFFESDGKTATQHTQIMALLCGVFGQDMEHAMLQALLEKRELAPATLYYRHYLFEAFHKCNRVDLIIQGFEFWKELSDMGLLTPLERNEPSRSDCHAWSSHPLYHLYASVLGIRPAAPGFREVLVRPHTLGLGNISARFPHPRGDIILEQTEHEGKPRMCIHSPQGLSISLYWQDNLISSSSGQLTV